MPNALNFYKPDKTIFIMPNKEDEKTPKVNFEYIFFGRHKAAKYFTL